MKKKFALIGLINFLFLFFLTTNVSAQQNHFIFIQADNQQPFSVTVNNKIYNSSSIGYVVIPKLTDAQYNLIINFPDNNFSQQKFTCTINNKDAGYQLKNNGDKSWSLFNFETQQSIAAGETEQAPVAVQDTTATQPTETKKSNTFGNMLSDVVNDSTLTKPFNVTNNVAENNAGANENLNQTDSTLAAETNTKGIIKAAERTGDDGTDFVFIDFNNTSSDTIRVFIPSKNSTENNTSNSAVANNADTSSITNNGIVENNSSTINSNRVASDTANKSINNPFYSAKDSTASSVATSANTGTATFLNNSNCTNTADDNDLNKMRKKMITESDPDKMIGIVKRYSKGKCLTTDQVKNLGALFLSDESRYNFFDSVYKSVSDFGNYPSLESQLIDPYYKKRFEVMLK
ncbi:MAG: DUF4476 domain-containing protein [Chitinophagaceae bacterium]